MNENQSLCSLPKSVAQDKNLSLKAKGLYWLMQDFIKGQEFDSKHFKSSFKAMCKDGDKAFNSAWKELISAGYLKIHRITSEKNGRFTYSYELLDIADKTTPPLIECWKVKRSKYGR